MNFNQPPRFIFLIIVFLSRSAFAQLPVAATAEELRSFLEAMPKAELHLHIEGTIPQEEKDAHIDALKAWAETAGDRIAGGRISRPPRQSPKLLVFSNICTKSGCLDGYSLVISRPDRMR